MAFTIKIQGKNFQNFQNFKLGLIFNSVGSVFSFEAFIDKNNASHRTLFKPFSYRKCEIFADGNLVLTGVILNQELTEDNKPNTIKVSGYSVTGVLEDCSIPIETYPLQHDGKTIAEIAEHLITPFGLKLVLQDDLLSNVFGANTPIETTSASPTDSIKGYLNKLCAQKNLVLTHDAQGRIVIRKVDYPTPVGYLREGGYTKIVMKCNGQAMHDQVTVIRQDSIDDPSEAETTLRNPFIVAYNTSVTPQNPFVPNYRPLTKEQSSDSEDNTDSVAYNILANEWRALTFEITLDSWYINGVLVNPSQIVTIDGDELLINGRVNLFVEAVSFEGDPSKQVATLSCVIPEVYTDSQPVNFFE